MENQGDGIDWEDQWRRFAPNFYDGIAHIDLSAYGGNAPKDLLLKPGGGFGDLSHPTTRLCLKLMAPLVGNTTVIDIGCGSGILTLAALLMGATRAIGLDIDENALEHAQANARLNRLEKLASFGQRAKRISSPLLIVMNMIFSEQKQAWNAQKALSAPKRAYPAIIVTSGILAEQTGAYLAWTKMLDWNLLKEETEGEWTGFLFFKKDTP